MLHIIVKNDHDVDLRNNSKIKKSCQYVVEKIEKVRMVPSIPTS
jgi:hypothetical protein